MRLNKYIAASTDYSRRGADQLITDGRVQVNGREPSSGQDIEPADVVTIDSRAITPVVNSITIMLNKPVGYVCSRNGQGSKTVYELLPKQYHHLQTVGRLDKDSSGLLLLTSDGELANQLTHPRYKKEKVYSVTLDKALKADDEAQLAAGVPVEDYISYLILDQSNDERTAWRVTMTSGRNRQIRKTFESVGYTVITLRRTKFAHISLDMLDGKIYAEVPPGSFATS